MDSPAVCCLSRVTEDSSDSFCAAKNWYVKSDKGNGNNNLPDDVDFASASTGVTTSSGNIFRCSPFIDVDVDEGPGFPVGVGGGVVLCLGITHSAGVWFSFWLISQVSCKTSDEK